MSFFNKKEDVIDIQLTQFGKNLLSEGNFKPVYYAFFDDNVLYDSSYAGFPTENQNSIEPRIQENTPALKTQYIFYGAETEIKRIANEIRGTNGSVPSMQPVADKHYALSAPIGTSALHTNLIPSWQLRFFAAELNESIHYVTGAHPTMKIPQLGSNIEYKTRMYSADSPPPQNTPVGFGQARSTKDMINGDASEYLMTSAPFQDGTYFVTEGSQLLLEIDEKNTDFYKENFDIEVFIVESVDMTGSIKTPGLPNKNTRELLRPLNFIKKQPTVVDDLLISSSQVKTSAQDPDDTAYYFEVNVDEEIAPETLCAVVAKLRSAGEELGHLADLDIDCPDSDVGVTAPFDVYGSNVTEEDIEECLD